MSFTVFSTINIITFLPYFTKFIALSVRDVLWLRIILIIAECGLFVRSSFFLDPPNYHVAFWNIVFIIVNITMAIRIMNERRPVPIPDDLKDLYEHVFFRKTSKEFIAFWGRGEIINYNNEYLIREGDKQDKLILILFGKCKVIKNEKELAVLGREKFVAEMSYLTGEPASADVKADGKMTVVCWDSKTLKDIKANDTKMWLKIKDSLTRDLIEKLKMAS